MGSAYQLVTAGQATVVFEDDIEMLDQENHGEWTMFPAAGAGVWTPVDPNGSTTTPARDATPGEGHKCWVTQNRNWDTSDVFDNDVDPASPVDLMTPTFDLEPGQTAIIDFDYWYYDRNPAGTQQPDIGDVELSVFWVRGGEEKIRWDWVPAGAARQWQHARFTVGTSIGSGNGQVKFRFADPGNDSVVEGGIDNVVVRCVSSCEQCCDADVNIDGNVDQDDIAYLIQVVGGAANPSGVDPDWNKDGNVDQDDVATLVNYISEGAGCP